MKMDLYELSLVINRIQEKAIREVFIQRNWQFIIAGVKKCEIPRLPSSCVFQDFIDDESGSDELKLTSDIKTESENPLSGDHNIVENIGEKSSQRRSSSDLEDYSETYTPASLFEDDTDDPDWNEKCEKEKPRFSKANDRKSSKRQSSPDLEDFSELYSPGSPFVDDSDDPDWNETFEKAEPRFGKANDRKPSQKRNNNIAASICDRSIRNTRVRNTIVRSSSTTLNFVDSSSAEGSESAKVLEDVKKETASPKKQAHAPQDSPAGFQCGNCSDSFKTFRELRLHLAEHKRAIEGSRSNMAANTQNYWCKNKEGNRVSDARREHVGRPSSAADDNTLADIETVMKFENKLLVEANTERMCEENKCKDVEMSPHRGRGRPRKYGPSQYSPTTKRKIEQRLKYRKMPLSTGMVNEGLTVEKGCEAFLCGNCSETFSSFRDLRLHLQLHKEVIDGSNEFQPQSKPALNATGQSRQCPTCGKTFPNAAATRVHERVHSGERPYLCNLCGKAFKQVSAFRNHYRTHTGEKPFKCTMCEMAFRQLSELQRHKRRHTGEKPQLCTICGKRFAEQSYLKSHMRLHTGEKPFSCRLCEKAFAQRTSLKVHMKSHHKMGGEVESSLSRKIAEESVASLFKSFNRPMKSHQKDEMDGQSTSLPIQMTSTQPTPLPAHISPAQPAPLTAQVSPAQVHLRNISIDFTQSTPLSQLSNPSKTNNDSRFESQTGLHPDFPPVNPRSNIPPSHMKTFHSHGEILQPHISLESVANTQPWPFFHPDINMSGVY